MRENLKYIFATAGVLLFGFSYALYTNYDTISDYFMPPTVKKEVHVHADFAFYILGQKIDFTTEKYQSGTTSTKHKSIHFHDGNDDVIHRHAEGITLSEFLVSIDVILTNTCLTLDTGTTYCTDEKNVLILFVNGQRVTNIESYITQEKDRVLLYYGDPNSPDISAYQNEITDQSCLYSGTCPERGNPPTESCGLTCEI
jgi:hypothetical protein